MPFSLKDLNCFLAGSLYRLSSLCAFLPTLAWFSQLRGRESSVGVGQGEGQAAGPENTEIC